MTSRFVIYCHTCRTTGQRYIGLTHHSMEDRWKGHVYDATKRGTRKTFHVAIREHGEADFDHEVLCETNSFERAQLLERFFIRYYDTLRPNGFNVTDGGEGEAPRPPRGTLREQVIEAMQRLKDV